MSERIHIAYAEVFRSLVDGAASIDEMCRASGLTYGTVSRFVNTLRVSPSCLRVCAWERDSMNRASIQVFEIGNGADEKRPSVKTGAQRTQAYGARKKQKAETALHSVWRPILEAA